MLRPLPAAAQDLRISRGGQRSDGRDRISVPVKKQVKASLDPGRFSCGGASLKPQDVVIVNLAYCTKILKKIKRLPNNVHKKFLDIIGFFCHNITIRSVREKTSARFKS